MTGQNNVLKKTLSLKLNKSIHEEIHSCILLCIEHGVVPEEEVEFMFEVAQEVAAKFKNTTKPYNLKLDSNKMAAVWSCVNVMLQNKVVREQKTAVMLVYALGEMGDLLDEELKLIEANESIMSRHPSDLASPLRKV